MNVECTKGEFGVAQQELNTLYSEPLLAGDNQTISKHACKEIAMMQKKSLTFMAKWHYDMVGSGGRARAGRTNELSTRQAGSSCHVHQSLWKDSESAFLDTASDPEHGMSTTMKSYMAGLLKYAREITYFLAPYINSYKRFQQKSTFAPTRAVWSHDNRTAGFRVVGHKTKGIRVECRIAGADCNPYLAYSAMLAAGLSGLREKLELEAPFTGDVYFVEGKPGIREVPKTLREATQEFNGSKMLRGIFGDRVVDHYTRAATWEQEEFDRRITDWELKRGFERS